MVVVNDEAGSVVVFALLQVTADRGTAEITIRCELLVSALLPGEKLLPPPPAAAQPVPDPYPPAPIVTLTVTAPMDCQVDCQMILC